MDLGVHFNSGQCDDFVPYDDNYDASRSTIKGVPLGPNENGLLRHIECITSR